MKRCPQCEKILNGNLFNKNKTRKDGLSCYCKECSRLLVKEYNSRPDVKARRKKERQKTEFKKHIKEYMKNYRICYNSRPEVKQHIKEYRQRPEVKERRKIKSLEYNNRPDVKERRKKQRQDPKFKKYRKKYYAGWIQTSDVKERLKIYQREYYQKPEVKARIKKYVKDNPEKVKKWNAKHTSQRKQLGTTIIMDNPFSDDIKVDFHHFNSLMMIPMPRVVHRAVTGSTRDIDKHREYNNEWIKKLYMIDISILFDDTDGDSMYAQHIL